VEYNLKNVLKKSFFKKDFIYLFDRERAQAGGEEGEAGSLLRTLES